MFKYSYDTLVYYGELIEQSIERVANAGYDGIEFHGEPAAIDTAVAKRKLDEVGLAASSICSIYTNERDLAHPDPAMRRQAVQYVKDVATMASEVGAPIMIVAPTACMKNAALADREQEWAWAVEGIREGARFANDLGVTLVIEAWNRYETYFLNRLDQAMDMLRDVNEPNVGIMGDLFHMNIEEASIPDALRQSGRHLKHIHFADTNRAAPGKGHLDFRPIMKALQDIGYDGYITMEILPASSDPFGTLRQGGGREFYDEYTKSSIEYLRSLEAAISRQPSAVSG